MPVIGAKHNVPIAIVVSSTIFALLHILNPNVAILSIVNLILYGVFAAVFVIWEKGLWGICALHSAWNWT